MIVAVALLGLVGAAAGMSVVFRAPLIEAAGEHFLAARGFAGIDLAVEHVGLTEATLSVRSQARDQPTIERLRLGYRPFEILTGRVREIVVSGLSLDIDVSRPQPAFGQLAGGSRGKTAAPGPRIVLDQAKATVRGLADAVFELTADGFLDLEQSPRRADLNLRLRAEAAGLEVSGRIVAESEDSRHALWLAEPLRLRLAEASPEALRRLGLPSVEWASRLDAPVRVDLSGATGRPAAQITTAERGGWRLDAVLTVDAQAGAASIRTRVLATTDHDRRFRPLDGEVRIQEGRLRIPAAQLDVRALAGWVHFGGEPLSASFRARLRHDAKAPAVAPFDLTLDLVEKPDRIEVFGNARWSERAIVPLDAQYVFSPIAAEVSLGPTSLTFGEGLQPKDLSPLAPAMAATGTVEAQGRLSWRPGRSPAVQGAVTARGLSLRTPDVAVEGLAGTVTASQISPLRTPPGQSVTAARVVAGVPLEDVRMTFRVGGAGGRTTLEIAEATARLADGTLAVREAVIDPAAAEHSLEVHLRSLSLSQLIANLGIGGLQGEGTLSGKLPLRFGAQGLAVNGGELSDSGAGLIRLDVGSARKMLEGQGEQVALVVQALENFHYDRLQLGVERPFARDVTLKVRMAGKNPDVLEGHPFDFNISLSANPDPILDALKEGRQLSGDLLKGAVGR